MIALDVPLAGIHRIEASAGTGKTWTVAALVARAIAEGRVDVRGLLVVTFTRAATHELRDRIRSRLALTAAWLSGAEPELGESDREFYAALGARLDDRGRARRRVEAALRGLDEAAIFTIHGFAHRVLTDRAFETRTPFDRDLVQDPRDVLQEVVDDFWRRELYAAADDLVAAVRASLDTPDDLADRYRILFGRRDLRVVAPEGDLRPVEAFRAACADLRDRMEREREALLSWFEDPAFNGNKVTRKLAEGRLAELDAVVGREDPHAGDTDKLDKLRPGYLRDAIKKKATFPEPVPDVLVAVERFLERRASASRALDAAARAFEARALAAIGPEFRASKRRRGVIDFDDVLSDLADALDGEAGRALAARVAARYPVAVVDEFQDTDPTQWTLFRRVYADRGDAVSLVLVGDPKQAIYSFRGADVFAYLDAAGDLGERFDLRANWRSHPNLVEAVNAMFSAVPSPFALDDIPFRGVEPARDAAGFERPVEGAPPVLRLRSIPTAELRGASGVGVGQEVAADAAAREAARLVASGVDAGDVAVLVRTGRQGRTVRDALRLHGLRAVLRTHESVFAGDAATDLGRILRALAAPTEERRVRAALATVTLGVSGDDLGAWAEDGGRWDAVLESWRAWHATWRRHGPARAIREVFEAHDVESRLLAREDGTRRLTDLSHLAERVQAAWDGGAPGFDRVLRGYAERRAAEELAAEDEAVRLDSDEDLVRIETIHASKGLEYPYVLCPFVWWMPGNRKGVDRDRFLLHHGGDDGGLVLDLSPDPEDAAIEAAERERLSEDLRLLYVAMTRAERRCELFWIPTGAGLGRAALSWLVHDGPRGDVRAFATSAAGLGEAAWCERLERLAARAPGALEFVRGMPDGPAAAPTPAPGRVVPPRTFRGRVGTGRRLTSFTALAESLDEPAVALDRPDWDAGAARSTPPGPSTTGRTRHDFPAGAGAGRAIHRAFEGVDFPAAARGEVGDLVRDALVRHGFDTAWAADLEEMIRDVVHVPIDPGGDVRLADVPRDRRAVEFEFSLVAEGEDGTGFDGPGLARALSTHGGCGPWASGPIAAEVARLDFRRTRGFVRGFIDLLFRSEGAEGDPRYWIVDWKSNRLGSDVRGYTTEAMEEEIARHAYWLQYLLYTVAVHRFLGTRVNDYDYDRHFGGVAYVFVRGVDRNDPQRGVFRDRPPRALVEAADRALGLSAEPGSGP